MSSAASQTSRGSGGQSAQPGGVMAGGPEIGDHARMGNIIRGGVVAVALIALTASAKKAEPFVSGTAPAAADSMDRAAQALVSRGFDVANQAATVVTSDWKVDASMGGENRQRWVISIRDGFVTVDSQCQFRIENPDPFTKMSQWDDCGADRAKGTSEEAAAIAREIGGS